MFWERCGEKGTLVHCLQECELSQPSLKTVEKFLKKLKIGMPHDPITPLVVTDQKERKSVSRRDIWAPMFKVELLMADKIW